MLHIGSIGIQVQGRYLGPPVGLGQLLSVSSILVGELSPKTGKRAPSWGDLGIIGRCKVPSEFRFLKNIAGGGKSLSARCTRLPTACFARLVSVVLATLEEALEAEPWVARKKKTLPCVVALPI